MYDTADFESFMRAQIINQNKNDSKIEVVIINIKEIIMSENISHFKFMVDDTLVGVCRHENLFKHMQLLKQKYYLNGKVVLFT